MACPCTFAVCGGRECETPPKDRYACHTKACGNEDLKEDETWTCQRCGFYFCDEHISDIGTDVPKHVCAPCGMILTAGMPGPVRWDHNDSDRGHAA